MSVVAGIAIAVFLLASLVCWALLFPDAVARLRERFRGKQVKSHGVSAVSQTKNETPIAKSRISLRVERRGLRGWLMRHWVLLTTVLALLAVPPLVILFSRQTVVLADFRGDDLSESGSMVAQLLRGERLTPPPPPPPEVFTTQEVRRLRPEIVTADRKWEQIDADLQQRVLTIYEVMRRQYGYEMVLIEGYRSPERQAELMAGGKATRAGAWQSCHQYGLGVDSAPIRDGKLQWDMNDEWTRRGYYLYGELAEQAGLDWGGNWRSIKDYVHVEMSDRCKTARAIKRAELSQQG